jgi:hypothetical protein
MNRISLSSPACRPIGLLVAALLSVAPLVPHANPLLGLSDPTRPPAGLVKSTPVAGGAAGGAAATEATGAASAPPPPPPAPKEAVLTLQLLRVDPATGAGVALINDQLLEPGARIEGWTLVSVSASEATLQGPKGRLRLSLVGGQVIERNPKSAQSRRGRKE